MRTPQHEMLGSRKDSAEKTTQSTEWGRWEGHRIQLPFCLFFKLYQQLLAVKSVLINKVKKEVNFQW